MNPTESQDENFLLSADLMKKFQYSASLLNRWLEVFGLSQTLELLDGLRSPYNSMWVQVNTRKIDYYSLFDIFEEMGYIVHKHPFFDDFIEVEVQKRELSGYSRDLPIIRVDHESSTNIALGRNVQTANIMNHDEFDSGETVCIADYVNNILAVGKTQVKSSEIAKLTQTDVVKVSSSLAYAPPLTELREYRRGFFSIMSPTQAVGVKSMEFDSKDSILVMSTDKGDVANYISEITNYKIPITVLAANEMQVKALRRNVERTKNKAIRILHRPFLTFVRETHEIKYTSFFIEPQNSRTAVIPVFSSNLGVDRLQQFSEKQQKLIGELYRCSHGQASITYITHSIDYLENEEVFRNSINKAYLDNQEFPETLRNLKKSKTIDSRDPPENYKEIKKELDKSTVYFDPLTTNNTGGFIAKLSLKQKE
jgi:16S rRNA C967 or C1407 C5-methylase (RsmB/RsmF family)